MAKQTATAQEIIDFFQGATEVTRPNLAQFEKETDKRVPSEVWNNKVKRGLYSLDLQTPQNHIVAKVDQQESKTVIEQSHVPIVVPDQKIVAREIDVFDVESFIPAVLDTYIPHGNFRIVDKLISSKHFFTLYVTGESGTGKNAMIEQACAKNRRPVVRVQITRETKEEHLIGAKTLIDGNIVYEDGPVIWAALNGAVLIVDEVATGDPNELLCLQRVLEGGEFFVKSLNRMITPKPGFAVIATDNTKGQGSDSGRWIGTGVLNSAFLDRFDMCLEQQFPNRETEIKILEKAYSKFNPNIDSAFIEKLVDWVQVIRRTYDNGGIDDIVSTRRAISIIKAKALWFSEDKSVEYGITRFNDTTKEAFKILWDKLNTGEIKND